MEEERYAARHTLDGVLSPYDIRGYIVPGGALLFFMYAFEKLARHLIVGHSEYSRELVHTPLRGLTLALMEDYGASGWLIQVVILAVIFSLAYVVGHVLATVSSLVVDRVFVAKGYGYPYRLFLFPDTDESSHNALSRSYYRGLVFWLPLALLLPLFASTAYRVGWWPFWVALLSLAPLVTVVLVTGLKLHVSRPSVAERLSETVYADPPTGSRWSRFVCFFVGQLFSSLYDHTAKVLARWISTRVPFPPELREMHKDCMQKEFGLNPQPADTSNWWFPYIHVRENSRVLSATIDNWLCLYAFSRNLSAAFFFASAYALSWLHVYQESAIKQWDPVDVGWLLAFAVLCFLLAITMLFRYYYIYAHYYSRFVLRAFLYLCARKSVRDFDVAPGPSDDGPG